MHGKLTTFHAILHRLVSRSSRRSIVLQNQQTQALDKIEAILTLSLVHGVYMSAYSSAFSMEQYDSQLRRQRAWSILYNCRYCLNSSFFVFKTIFKFFLISFFFFLFNLKFAIGWHTAGLISLTYRTPFFNMTEICLVVDIGSRKFH